MTARFLSLMLLLVGCLLAAPPSQAQEQADPQALQEIQHALTRAETWYWWARASANAKEHHERSELEYERARQAALRLPADQQQPWLSHAETGLTQVQARVGNSFDTFRSVYAPVWWFLEADPTVELADDAEMLAVSNAWQATRASLLGGRLVDQYWAVVRCSDCREDGTCPADAQSGGIPCDGLRDELMIHIDSDPRLNSVTDDNLRALLPWSWQALLEPEAIPEPQLTKLCDALDLQRLVLLDLKVVDLIEQEPGVLPATRIDMIAKVWVRKDQETIATIRNTGIGAGAFHRVPHRLGWIGLMMALALGWAVGWGLQRDRGIDRSFFWLERRDDILVALVCWLLGAVVSWAAGRISGGLLPAWEATAISPVLPGLPLPRIDQLSWPAAHGAIALAGPIVVSAVIATRLVPRFSARFRDHVDLMIVVVTSLAGALAMLFAPMVQVIPGEGWWIAGALSFAALAVGFAMVPSLSSMLGQRYGRALHRGWGQEPRNPRMGTALGFAMLLVLLPMGFFYDWYPAVTVGVLVVACMIFFLGRPRTLESRQVGDGDEQSETEVGHTDTLQRPPWTPLGTRDPKGQAAWLKPSSGCRLLLIEGAASSGKTRLMEEIRSEFGAGEHWALGTARGNEPLLEGPDSGPATEAYGLVVQALRSLGLGVAPEATDEPNEAIQRVFEEAIKALPGFGLLFDLTLSGQDQGLTEQRIRHDMIRAIRNLACERDLLICLDDAHWADPSSIELLGHLLKACRDEPRESEHIAIIATVWTQCSSDTQQALNALRNQTGEGDAANVRVQSMGTMSAEETRAFLVAVGLADAAAEALTEVASDYTRARPGELLDFLRALLNEGLLRRMGEAQLELTGPLEAEVLAKAIPASSKERYHRLLDTLEPRLAELLECAALCGRVFSVQDVAAGLGISRIEAVRGLRFIEDQHGFVMDPEEPDDHFAFVSTILQTTLLERLYRPRKQKSAKRNREFAKEIHRLIARSMMERSHTGQALRLAGHCFGAGPRMAPACIEHALRAAHQAMGRYASHEMGSGIKLARAAMASMPKGANLERAKMRIAWLESSELRLEATAENKNELAAKLRPFLVKLRPVSEGWPQPRELVYTYLEAHYDGRDRERCEEIRSSVSSWLADPAWGDLPTRATARFYALLAENRLDQKYDPVPALTELERELEEEPAGRERDLILAMVQNNRANSMAWGKGPHTNHPKSLALLERSNELKRRHGDQRGVAMGLGSMASILAEGFDDREGGLRLLRQDLELIETMCFTSDESGVRNKIATFLWQISEAEPPGFVDMRLEALTEAMLAMTLAIELDRSRDFGFTLATVPKYATWTVEERPETIEPERHTQLRATAQRLIRALEQKPKEEISELIGKLLAFLEGSDATEA